MVYVAVWQPTLLTLIQHNYKPVGLLAFKSISDSLNI